LENHSPAILTGVGIVGTVSTAVLTGRATFKAAELIAEEQKLAETEIRIRDRTEGIEGWEKGDLIIPASTLSRTDKVKLVWRQYLPPVASGVLTITSIYMANKISSKIRDEVAQDRVTANPGNAREILIGGGEVLCYDMMTGRYFNSTMETIKAAENRINYELVHHMSASLSMFYEEVGLPPTTFSDMVGWNADNRMDVQVSTVLSADNRPCLAIDFSKHPFAEYDKFYN
jgi:hypothetical protein